VTDGIVIIGAGEAGVRTALGLRSTNASIPITLIGEEPVEPYERPPLSKTVLENKEECGTPPIISSFETLVEKNISFVHGSIVKRINRIKRQVMLDDGVWIPYLKLVIATGARPRRLSIEGEEHFFYLRTFADAQSLYQRLRRDSEILVIGGGLIGLELAACARGKGCQVTVIEAAPILLSRVAPACVADYIRARHKTAGTKIIMGTQVRSADMKAGKTHVALSDGTTIVADTVICGIGAYPNESLAEASGLDVNDGIIVDAQLKTSDPDIYAIGDCAKFPQSRLNGIPQRLESWRNAYKHAEFLAENLFAPNASFSDIPWFWSDQYNISMHGAGYLDLAEEIVIRKLEDQAVVAFGIDSDGALVSVTGVGLGNSIAKDIRIAEQLINVRAKLSHKLLADVDVSLRHLLRSVV